MTDNPARAPRGANNRRLSETIGRHRALLLAIQGDAEAAALVATRGYPAARLQEGLALAEAALAAYEARDRDAGARVGAGEALRAQEAATRRQAQDLRGTLRALYDGQADHLTALGATTARVPADRDAFLTETRATLRAARRSPYLTALADTGMTAAQLDALGTALDTLEASASAHGAARGNTADATASRDAAFDALQTWMNRFRRLVRPAFRDAPAVATRVRFT